MPDTTTIGQIFSVSSATAGQIKPLSGSVFSYSDATLATRSIVPVLGEYVICNYDGATTTGITPLTDIYAQGLTDANDDNELIGSDIRRQLQIYNACASKKGADYIEKFEKEIPCDNLKNDAEMMVGLIDSIVGFIPEDEIVSGRQATYLLIVTGIGNPAINMDVTITIGSASYTRSIGNSPTRTASVVASNLAAYINSFYPGNYGYYAEASGANLILSGSTFSTANSTAVTVSVVNGTITAAAPNYLSGGSASVAQGENGITNQDCQKILDKLNKLCSTPCEEVVNFENS